MLRFSLTRVTTGRDAIRAGTERLLLRKYPGSEVGTATNCERLRGERE
jgi:hypothetical protein